MAKFTWLSLCIIQTHHKQKRKRKRKKESQEKSWARRKKENQEPLGKVGLPFLHQTWSLFSQTFPTLLDWIFKGSRERKFGASKKSPFLSLSSLYITESYSGPIFNLQWIFLWKEELCLRSLSLEIVGMSYFWCNGFCFLHFL